MTQQQDLEDRLDQLNRKLSAAVDKLDVQHSLHDGHKQTSDELEARYRSLKQALHEQVCDLQAHGEHVSALEKDMLNWLNKH